jgi:hypothetical protein
MTCPRHGGDEGSPARAQAIAPGPIGQPSVSRAGGWLQRRSRQRCGVSSVRFSLSGNGRAGRDAKLVMTPGELGWLAPVVVALIAYCPRMGMRSRPGPWHSATIGSYQSKGPPVNARKRAVVFVPVALSATLLTGVGTASAVSNPFSGNPDCASGVSVANFIGRITGNPGAGGEFAASIATSAPGAVAQIAVTNPCKV